VLRRQGSSQSDSSGFAESELTDYTADSSAGSKVGLHSASVCHGGVVNSVERKKHFYLFQTV